MGFCEFLNLSPFPLGHRRLIGFAFFFFFLLFLGVLDPFFADPHASFLSLRIPFFWKLLPSSSFCSCLLFHFLVAIFADGYGSVSLKPALSFRASGRPFLLFHPLLFEMTDLVFQISFPSGHTYIAPGVFFPNDGLKTPVGLLCPSCFSRVVSVWHSFSLPLYFPSSLRSRTFLCPSRGRSRFATRTNMWRHVRSKCASSFDLPFFFREFCARVSVPFSLRFFCAPLSPRAASRPLS